MIMLEERGEGKIKRRKGKKKKALEVTMENTYKKGWTEQKRL